MSNESSLPIEVALSQAALSQLELVRNQLSRLYYAPSRKTLVHSLICLVLDHEVPDGTYDNGQNDLPVCEFSFKIDARYSRKFERKFGKSPNRDKEVSLILDRALKSGPKLWADPEILGSLLRFLRRRAYLKNRGVISLRLPDALRSWVSESVDVNEEDLDDFHCWASRIAYRGRQFQEKLQKGMRRLLRSHREEAISWPPYEWGRFLREAEELLSATSTTQIITVVLSKQQWRDLRELRANHDQYSDEVVAIALLTWKHEREGSMVH